MKMLLLLILPIANTILTLINLCARTRTQGNIPLPVADRRHGEQREAAKQRAQYVY